MIVGYVVDAVIHVTFSFIAFVCFAVQIYWHPKPKPLKSSATYQLTSRNDPDVDITAHAQIASHSDSAVFAHTLTLRAAYESHIFLWQLHRIGLMACIFQCIAMIDHDNGNQLLPQSFDFVIAPIVGVWLILGLSCLIRMAVVIAQRTSPQLSTSSDV